MLKAASVLVVLMLAACASTGPATETDGPAEPAPDETPRVELVDPEVDKDCVAGEDGRFTKDAIQACIHARLAVVQNCYVMALKVDRSLSGKLGLGLRVQADGTMGEVGTRVEGFANPGFEACVQESVGRWKFPARPAGSAVIRITYPVHLRTM